MKFLLMFVESIIKVMKKNIVLLVLLCIHFYVLLSQLVYWMLDFNYGNLYYINEILNNQTNIGYDAVGSLYKQILFDIYYGIFSSLVIIIYIVIKIKK